MKRITLALVLFLAWSVSASADTVKVKPAGALLFTSASASSPLVGRLPAGAVLEVVKIEGEWVRVRDAKTRAEGFVHRAEVEIVKGAKPKRAPGPGDWTDRGFLTANGLFQGGKSGFSETFQFPLNAENGSVTTTYPLKSGMAYDVGGGVRVWRNLAVAVSVSGFSQSGSGNLTASLPHPFFFNASRAIGGTVDSLQRKETEAVVSLAWVFPVGKRTLVTVSGGPAFCSVRQSIVQRVLYAEAYPYDTAVFTGAVAEGVSKSKTGFAGGIDFAYFLTKTVGLGAMVRYAGASISLPSPSGSLSANAGGLQAGIGLRLRIPVSVPKPRRPATPARPPVPPRK